MVDIKAILAAAVAAFALLPPSLTIHHSIDEPKEEISYLSKDTMTPCGDQGSSEGGGAQ